MKGKLLLAFTLTIMVLFNATGCRCTVTGFDGKTHVLIGDEQQQQSGGQAPSTPSEQSAPSSYDYYDTTPSMFDYSDSTPSMYDYSDSTSSEYDYNVTTPTTPAGPISSVQDIVDAFDAGMDVPVYEKFDAHAVLTEGIYGVECSDYSTLLIHPEASHADSGEFATVYVYNTRGIIEESAVMSKLNPVDSAVVSRAYFVEVTENPVEVEITESDIDAHFYRLK